jgi:transposase
LKQEHFSTRCGGIDVGKHHLDVAVEGGERPLKVRNDIAGIASLVAWLREAGVRRVGLEASGGYERLVLGALHEADFEVVLHQPAEVRLYARIIRRRAKNDAIDAALIAAFTGREGRARPAPAPVRQALAERLTIYEQMADEIARMKRFLEHITLDDIRERILGQIASLAALKDALAREIREAISQNDDLDRRYRLLLSLPGVGPVTAAALVVRMPELGTMERGQAASLLGVAPFDRDSGRHKGLRFISGGRARPRRLMYLAAIAAKRSDPAFKTFAARLTHNGKPPKVATVAVMRKLIEAANLVLKRDQPWLKPMPA